MKKERLTLKKKLEAKLEALKSARALKAAQSKTSKKGDVVTTTPSIINFGTMKSSLFLMYLMSVAVYILKNMPFTSKLISGVSILYGKAKVLKILALFRKLFVLFNALIGVLTVYKLTGVLDGSVVAGITGLGNTYIEIFTNFSKKVFDWFFDLFDQKIVPKGSDDSKSFFSSSGSTSANISSKGSVHGAPQGYWESLNKNYLTKIDESENISWYRDLTTWGYILGGVAIAVTVVGIGYICYSYWVETLPSAEHRGTNTGQPLSGTIPSGEGGHPRIDVNSPGGTNLPPTNGGNSSSSSSFWGGIKSVFSGIGGAYTTATNYMNPVSRINQWLGVAHGPDNVSDYRRFMESQRDLAHSNTAFFPHTANNPFDPWYKKLRLAVLGETLSERNQRLDWVRNNIWSQIPNVDPNIQSAFGNPGGLGIHFPPHSPSPWGTRTAVATVKTKLATLPPTPSGFYEGGSSDWLRELPYPLSPLNLGLGELGATVQGKDILAGVDLSGTKA